MGLALKSLETTHAGDSPARLVLCSLLGACRQPLWPTGNSRQHAHTDSALKSGSP